MFKSFTTAPGSAAPSPASLSLGQSTANATVVGKKGRERGGDNLDAMLVQAGVQVREREREKTRDREGERERDWDDDLESIGSQSTSHSLPPRPPTISQSQSLSQSISRSQSISMDARDRERDREVEREKEVVPRGTVKALSRSFSQIPAQSQSLSPSQSRSTSRDNDVHTLSLSPLGKSAGLNRPSSLYVKPDVVSEREKGGGGGVGEKERISSAIDNCKQFGVKSYTVFEGGKFILNVYVFCYV
jgi:hypothetical protein